ncbi:MAG: TonB-dependent receptor [Bacteroidales bacterium]|nr:TonB-dependent receptor [Bacteroidales bacterium]
MKRTIIVLMLLVVVFQSVFADVNPDKSNWAGGVLMGRIVDENSVPLPGAAVYIESTHVGVVSDIDGFYKLSNLKPGTYRVQVSYLGFEAQEMDLEIVSGATIEKNIVMKEGLMLEQAVVKGTFNDQRKALNMQKNAMGVSNVVSADQVGKFPDSNIGDALKRINGVNVQYDQGESRFGQVRGTSADLSSVTVNGNRIPSAEGDTRNVQLDLIPADMIQTIELKKVVTSDMDGDAIGGAINLVTKNTPYSRILNFTLGLGGGMISKEVARNVGATYGDRFFNDKFGVMAALSYQYNPGGSDNTEFEYELSDEGKAVLKEAQVRQYYVNRQRQSYSLALDYKFNPLHKISFKGILNIRDDWENRYRISYKKLTSKASKQSVVLQTKAGSSDNRNARLEKQKTMDFTLDGEHHFGALEFNWAASYSRATEDRPNERYAALKYSGYDFASTMVDVGKEQPYSSVTLPALTEKGWRIDEITNSNQSIVENEFKAKIDFDLPLVTGEYGNTLKFGAKFTMKDKSRNTSFYSYDNEAIAGWENYLIPEVREGFMPGKMYPIGTKFISTEFLGNIDFGKLKGKEVLEEEAGNYKAKETISSLYVRFDQKIGEKFDATVGLRAERTDLLTSGMTYTMDENEKESLNPTGDYTNSYTNLLPSLLLRYRLGEDGNLRASVTKTLSRPKYSALVANKSFNLADLEATIGDPSVKPAQAWNFDLSADYYFKSVGLVSAGIFYKNIKNVNVETIGYYTGKELGLAGNEEIFLVTQNINAYDANVFGAELAIQRDFGFITPALKCLGFYGTYTYTHSKTYNYNEHLGIKDTDNIRMAGSPEHTLNASLYFEMAGFSARLSYNFASAFVDEMNLGSRELDRYYDKVNYLDFNAAYTWGRKAKFTIFADATNLLNQPLRYYQGDSRRTMQVEYYGVRFNFGLKINL